MAPSGVQAAGRREQVLELLRDADEPMSIADIAGLLGVHVNTVRFHLDTLVDNGQVERTTAGPGAPGRPRQLFGPVRGMDPMGPRHYQGLAEALVAALAAEPDPGRRGVEAGRAWGRRQAISRTDEAVGRTPVDEIEAVSRLVGMLDEIGFAPEPPATGAAAQIALHNCPFLELALDRADVVCPVHLGLMQGALESWDSPVTVGRLNAFVEPDLCVAHLSRRDALP